MQPLCIRDVMSSPVMFVSSNTRLPAIKRLMREHHIRHLPVVDAVKLVGIISLGDVRNAFPWDTSILSIYELSSLLDKITAADILRGVTTVDVAASIAEGVRLLLLHRIGSLPVLDGDRLVDIVTASDILRAVVETDGLPPTTARDRVVPAAVVQANQ